MYLAVPSGVQSIAGPQGVPGPAGPQGDPTVGTQGPQGATGIGPQGPQGIPTVGTQGFQGAAGVGPQGTQGPQGVPGVVPPFAENSVVPVSVLNNPPAPWLITAGAARVTRAGSIVGLVAIYVIRGTTQYALLAPISFDFVLPKATFGTPVPIIGTTLSNFQVFIRTIGTPSDGVATLLSQDATTVTYRISVSISTTLLDNIDYGVELNCAWYTQ